MRKLLFMAVCVAFLCLPAFSQSKSLSGRTDELLKWENADDESKCLSDWPFMSRGPQYTKQMLDACRQAARNLRSSVNGFEQSQLYSIGAYLKLKQENDDLRSKVSQFEQSRTNSDLAFEKLNQAYELLRSSCDQNSVKEALVFYWFDEQVRKNSTIFHIVITARAYDEVIAVLQKTLGEKTTKLRPETYPFRRWLGSATPQSVASLFFWWDETLSDDTPVMDFYMTKRAYEQTVAIVRKDLELPEYLVPQPKRSKWRAFLEALAYVSAAALQGGAEAYAAEQQRMQGESATWELRRLNSTLDAMRWQMLQDQFARENARQVSEWRRTMQRLSNGRWP